ncbi:MAG: hypothetical protein J2P57_24640, partial [Acidimicrobiaceae bacterium]|nr:hypothetical protein [Acidimicrobiaceae bacterium]
MATSQPPLADIQGNVLRGYGTRYEAVRHLVLEVVDPASAREALGALPVTNAEVVPARAGRSWCCNVGITFAGLAALGVPRTSLDTFPPEFRAGMPARSWRLGDVGPSDPSGWIPGLAATGRVHVLVSITGLTPGDLDAPARDVLSDGRAWRTVCDPLDGAALAPGDRSVHFGYLDGISQPRFVGIHDPDVYPDHEFAPLGTVLLGYPAAVPSVRWTVPSPEVLGRNGAFNAFRILEQDVAAFEAYLASTSA